MAARMLKHLRAFKKHDRMGYPSDFTDSHESFSCGEEEYKQMIEDGLTFTGKRENPNDETYTRHVSYLNIELINYAESVVQAGLMQLAIYFRSLWD